MARAPKVANEQGATAPLVIPISEAQRREEILSDLTGVWKGFVGSVLDRELAVSRVATNLQSQSYVASREIASTDIFVEKAEENLSHRAKEMKSSARLMVKAFIANIVLFILLYYIFRSFFVIDVSNHRTAIYDLVKGIVKNGTFVGIFLSLQYVIISLYRAFMHEATSLENRIHSLRLGRLFLYIKYSSARDDDLKSIRDSISASDLKDAFGWNIETGTAFADIDPKQVSKSWYSIFSDLVGALRKKD